MQVGLEVGGGGGGGVVEEETASIETLILDKNQPNDFPFRVRLLFIYSLILLKYFIVYLLMVVLAHVGNSGD